MDQYNTQIDQAVPPDAPSASSIKEISREKGNLLSKSSFLVDHSHSHVQRGRMLGIARPVWLKVCESEERLWWMKKMVERKLLVRDLEAYAKQIETKLRSEEANIREKEREIILDLMRLKLKDEKRCLRKLREKKNEMRRWLKGELGIRQLESTMRLLRDEVRKRKRELQIKYKEKLEHLEEIRKRQLEDKFWEKPENIGCYEN